MSILDKTLDEITESDLSALIEEEIPESYRLEYKRQLDLGKKKDKTEAAKDVSAMANAQGGLILYGIDEKHLDEGDAVAGKICPLTDESADSRLVDVLVSNMFPRPRLEARKVHVPNGFVLIVEVHPAFGGDLYMVTGFKENRFYRRNDKRTILMDEPEIREAYARIAATRQALEKSMEEAIQAEVARAPHLADWSIVAPWYGPRDLVDPRQFGPSLGQDLANGVLDQNELRRVACTMTVASNGYRGQWPSDRPLHECDLYVSICRNGLVCYGSTTTIYENRDVGQGQDVMYPWGSIELVVAALLTARRVLQQAAHWGPVRVEHRLRAEKPWHLVESEQAELLLQLRTSRPVDAGQYLHVVPEFVPREHGWRFNVVLRELLDQLFQTGGRERCPWFDESGKPNDGLDAHVNSELLKHFKA